ncbi:reverse transcriptase zinc-binding domain-containing protein [Tanacetum coccineum]
MKNNADAAGDLDNVESSSVIKERVDSSISQVEEISELVQEDLIDKDKQGHEEMNGADYMDGGINDRQQNDTMIDLIHNGDWNWPNHWLVKYPILNQIHVPNISHQDDYVVWIDESSRETKYSVKKAWESLREKWPNVNWYHVVWFSQCVPKHAFMMWLAIQGKLLTQDRLMKWNKDKNLKCPLCKTCPDSHDHLFFGCDFSKKVWEGMKKKGMFSFGCNGLKDTVVKLVARKFKKRSVEVLIKDLQREITIILMTLSLKESGAAVMGSQLSRVLVLEARTNVDGILFVYPIALAYEDVAASIRKGSVVQEM